ncbi:hypothetical protein EJB05_47033 [Eragrostis curvula]|uniref:Uncharacterized protein n=1 Tax=Eragrostis curvula TaxID=38414 RepID=A0A5J9T6M2_9POAL|nr:hypothetical protein EJB05_47033 [Eragrostis curvula]
MRRRWLQLASRLPLTPPPAAAPSELEGRMRRRWLQLAREDWVGVISSPAAHRHKAGCWFVMLTYTVRSLKNLRIFE